MKRRINFTISVASTTDHPFTIAEKAFSAAGISGYTVTSAKRSEIFENLIQVSITSTFDTVPSKSETVATRLFYNETLSGSLSDVPGVRFVCVDSVRTVFGRTSLAKEVSERLDAVLRHR